MQEKGYKYAEVSRLQKDRNNIRNPGEQASTSIREVNIKKKRHILAPANLKTTA
jgi:hypothetical protein